MLDPLLGELRELAAELSRVVLGHDQSSDDGELHLLDESAVDYALKWLRLDAASTVPRPLLRLLVAVQLSPRAALDYSKLNPKPRWRIISDYLERDVGLASGRVEPVARRIATVLDDWDTERKPVAALAPRLFSRGQQSCGVCRLPFSGTPESVRLRDPYKPIYRAVNELTRVEVDHISPIGLTGTNDLQNLRLLCRACNGARGGDGVVLSPIQEIRCARMPLVEVPRRHLFRLLVWLVEASSGVCSICRDATDNELTFRPFREEASLTRKNLRLVCYECVRGGIT